MRTEDTGSEGSAILEALSRLNKAKAVASEQKSAEDARRLARRQEAEAAHSKLSRFVADTLTTLVASAPGSALRVIDPALISLTLSNGDSFESFSLALKLKGKLSLTIQGTDATSAVVDDGRLGIIRIDSECNFTFMPAGSYARTKALTKAVLEEIVVSWIDSMSTAK